MTELLPPLEDLHALEFAATQRAIRIARQNNGTFPAFVMVSGHEADGLIVPSNKTLTPFENAAWGAAVLGYPCDAVTVIACFPATQEMTISYDPPILADNMVRRPMVCTWAHMIPTGETLTTISCPARETDTDGWWPTVRLQEQELSPLFSSLRADARHETDSGLPIQDGEREARRASRKKVKAGAGPDYAAALYRPGRWLATAGKG